MDLILDIITGLLSVFFLFASSIKILAWQKTIFETQLQFFISYGLNRQVMMLIGFIELFGAITIWFQGSLLGASGAMAILCTSAGAIFFHLRFDTWKAAIPALVTLTLSFVILLINSDIYLSLLNRLFQNLSN